MNGRNRAIFEFILEVLACGLVAYANVRLVIRPEEVSIVWFPAGIVVAGLLRRPPRIWVPFALLCGFAAVPADLSMGRDIVHSMVLNVADAAGYVLMGTLIRRFAGPSMTLLRFRDAYTFLWTVALGSLVSGLVAGGAFAALGHTHEFWGFVRILSTAVALGSLAVVPVILGLRRRRAGELFSVSTTEAVILSVLASTTTCIVFLMPAKSSALALSLVYVPVLVLAVCALRRALAETSFLCLMFAVVASASFYYGTGPARALQLSGADRVLWIDAFVWFVLSGALILGSMNDERRRALHRLVLDRNRTLRRVDERTNELQRAISDLESFSYSVSHDLRAPLRGIALHVQLLEEDLGKEISPPCKESVLAIRERIDRMNRIISGLLRLAKAQRKGLQLARIDVRSLLADILIQSGANLEDGSVKIMVGELPDCYADQDLLRQVFENLLSNALKYGSLARNPRIDIDGRLVDGGVLYTVSDNGPGFEPSLTDSVFEAFQRGHAPQSSDGEGVGLAIVKHIALRHGGRVEAEATPGHGATFKFWIPRAASSFAGGSLSQRTADDV